MTRKLIFALALSLGLSGSIFAQAGAVPAAGASGKIGVINIQAAIVSTNEGKRDFEELQKKFEPKQAELKNLNEQIDTAKKQLAAQQDKLNDDERNNRVHNIEQQQKNFQRSLEDAQNEFQQQQAEIANRIGNKMMQVVEKYAKDHNIALVLDVSNQTSPVLWASEATNITQEIVNAYNAQSGVAAPPPAAPTPNRPTGQAPAKKPSTTTPPK
jgi:outer membrane protein